MLPSHPSCQGSAGVWLGLKRKEEKEEVYEGCQEKGGDDSEWLSLWTWVRAAWSGPYSRIILSRQRRGPSLKSSRHRCLLSGWPRGIAEPSGPEQCPRRSQWEALVGTWGACRSWLLVGRFCLKPAWGREKTGRTMIRAHIFWVMS